MSKVSRHFQQQKKVTPNDAQQHKNKNVTQSSPPSSFSSSSSSATASSTLSIPGFDLHAEATKARVGTHGWEADSDAEVLLRKFDLDLSYGPTQGLSRRERFLRAQRLGLEPPAYVLAILDAAGFDEVESNTRPANARPLELEGGEARERSTKPETKESVSSHSLFEGRI